MHRNMKSKTVGRAYRQSIARDQKEMNPTWQDEKGYERGAGKVGREVAGKRGISSERDGY